jgi:hypothetical protein
MKQTKKKEKEGRKSLELLYIFGINVRKIRKVSPSMNMRCGDEMRIKKRDHIFWLSLRWVYLTFFGSRAEPWKDRIRNEWLHHETQRKDAFDDCQWIEVKKDRDLKISKSPRIWRYFEDFPMKFSLNQNHPSETITTNSHPKEQPVCLPSCTFEMRFNSYIFISQQNCWEEIGFEIQMKVSS